MKPPKPIFVKHIALPQDHGSWVFLLIISSLFTVLFILAWNLSI